MYQCNMDNCRKHLTEVFLQGKCTITTDFVSTSFDEKKYTYHIFTKNTC